MSSRVQAVRFPRTHWTLAQARAWLKTHKKVPIRIDTTVGQFRARMISPTELRGWRYRIKTVRGKYGPIQLDVAFPRKRRAR